MYVHTHIEARGIKLSEMHRLATMAAESLMPTHACRTRSSSHLLPPRETRRTLLLLRESVRHVIESTAHHALDDAHCPPPRVRNEPRTLGAEDVALSMRPLVGAFSRLDGDASRVETMRLAKKRAKKENNHVRCSIRRRRSGATS